MEEEETEAVRKTTKSMQATDDTSEGEESMAMRRLSHDKKSTNSDKLANNTTRQRSGETKQGIYRPRLYNIFMEV